MSTKIYYAWRVNLKRLNSFIDQFHDQVGRSVVFAVIVQGHDMRRLYCLDRFDLANESLPHRRIHRDTSIEHFYRSRGVSVVPAAPKDLRHPTPPDLLLEPIAVPKVWGGGKLAKIPGRLEPKGTPAFWM